MKKSKELCSLWNNEQDLQTGNVRISELHEFRGHVEHDMQLFELSKSIEEKGVLVPLVTRNIFTHKISFYCCQKEL